MSSEIVASALRSQGEPSTGWVQLVEMSTGCIDPRSLTRFVQRNRPPPSLYRPPTIIAIVL